MTKDSKTKDSKESRMAAVRRLLLGAIGWETPPSEQRLPASYVALEEQWVAECMRWLKGKRMFPMPPSYLFAPGYRYQPNSLPLDALVRDCQKALEEVKPVEKAPAVREMVQDADAAPAAPPAQD